VSGWMPIWLAAAGLLSAIGWLGWRRFGRRVPAEPIERIGRQLSRVPAEIAGDLRRLQLDDAADELARGWNMLLEAVAAAREELEELRLGRHARETLERYQARWMTDLVARMPYGLITVSDDWTITYANAAAERMLHAGSGGLKDRSLRDLIRNDLSPFHPGRGIALDRTFELKTAEASVRLTSLAARDDAECGETVFFLHDVSQQKAVERERSQFLYHVTHELRTPLTNIRAYAETLSEGVLKDEAMLRECYNVIVGETQRLSRLVEDILSLSQMEAGAARLTMDDVNTARLVRQVVEDMQAQADDKGVELILSLPAKMPTIRGDKDRLAVLLTNLVGNAIKYTPSRGRVEVRAEDDGQRFRVEVRDTGIGIAPEDQPRVFEKFYRSADERVAQQPGTGLGLALAMEIARAHGGTIELSSTPGEGTIFTAILPVGRLAAVRT